MKNKEALSTHKPKVLFYVQYHLGNSHFNRDGNLSRAMKAATLAVTIFSSGKDVSGVNIGSAQLVQLPPMRSKDEYFSVMLDDKKQPVDDGLRSAWRHILLNTDAKLKPSLALTDLFPFGRCHLRGENIPTTEAALNLSPQPKIIGRCGIFLLSQAKKSADQKWLRWCSASAIICSRVVTRRQIKRPQTVLGRTKSSCQHAAGPIVSPYSARQSLPAHKQYLQNITGYFSPATRRGWHSE